MIYGVKQRIMKTKMTSPICLVIYLEVLGQGSEIWEMKKILKSLLRFWNRIILSRLNKCLGGLERIIEWLQKVENKKVFEVELQVKVK